MMPAAKHLDPILGVDIHIIQPPGPVPPLPIPHPFVGIVLDPFDYVPIVGSTVKINAMHRAIAGTAGKAVPPHIPIGGTFVKPPSNECEMFMGSATVEFDGDAASHTVHPALSCQCVGMPAPPRPNPKKKSKMKSLVLPMSVVLPIPAGPPVLIGGPPTISLMALGMKLGMAMLGRGLRRLAKTKGFKRAMAAFKKTRQKACKNMKPGFLKCKVLKAEPVDSVTGEVVVEQQDFSIPGRIPIEWNRRYGSHNHRAGVCGYGWETPADARLVLEEDGTILFYDGEPGASVFPAMPHTEPVREPANGALLSRTQDGLRVRTKEGLIYSFPGFRAHVNEVLIDTVSDLRGNYLKFVRDEHGLKAIQESAGRCIEVVSRNGLIQKMDLRHPDYPNLHPLIRCEYSRRGDLAAVYDALNAPYRFYYGNHRLVQHRNRNGLSFHYEYDSGLPDPKCIHSWGDGGLYNYHFEYLPEIGEIRITDSLGHVTTIICNEDNLPIQEVNPLGGVTEFEYDEVGRTCAVVDPDGHRTEYEYDERGNLTKLVWPDATSQQTEYSDLGAPLRFTDPGGHTWEQVWNQRGLLEEQITPLGHRTSYRYNERGDLIAFTEPRGHVSHLEYDAYGNLTGFLDPLGNTTRFESNAFGYMTRKTDALGRTTTYEYDLLGQLTKTVLPSGAALKCSYDSEGNPKRCVNENGAVTCFDYYGLGEVQQRVLPDGSRVRYRYDTEERLIEVVNQRGESFHFVRDPLGRVVEEIDYWGQSRTFTYSSSGYVEKVRDPLGRSVLYERDPLGRIVREVLPNETKPGDTIEEVFAYDPIGNLVAAENPDIRIERTFDPEGRLVRERQGTHFTIENLYDQNGNRIERRTTAISGDVASSHTVRYEYNELDLATGVSVDGELPLCIDRNNAGEIVREQFGTAITRALTYNQDGYLASQSVMTHRKHVSQVAYAYDPGGNLTEKDDSVTGTQRFSFDSRERVTDYVDPAANLRQIPCDSAGDRFATCIALDPSLAGSRSGGAGAREWQRTGQFEGVTYRFDRAGNLVERVMPGEHGTFVWNASQRLVESRRSDIPTAYRYDALGRRIGKQTGETRTFFYWDGAQLIATQQVAQSADHKGQQPSRETHQFHEWVYYPDTFVPCLAVRQSPREDDAAPAMSDRRSKRSSEEAGGTDGAHSRSSGTLEVYLYDNDPNGCPTRAYDLDGDMAWAVRLTPWGKVARIHIEDFQNPIRLQGQYLDEETGLHYNFNRYYDPHTGQFVSQDPMGLSGGTNCYEYAPNALGWADPLGLSCNRLRGPGGRFRAPRTAAEELGTLPQFAGRKKNAVERTLKRRGYAPAPAHSGGTVWTKSMPDGNTVAVRVDPPMVRTPPQGWADEVPHAHKEVVPTSSVSGGNYPGSAASRFDDAGNPASTPADIHIPIRARP